MLHSAFLAVLFLGTTFQAESEFEQPVPSSSSLAELNIDSSSSTLLLVPPVSQASDPSKPAKLDVPTKQVPADVIPTSLEQQVFELINQARANPGQYGYGSLPAVPPLHWNAALLHIGRVHSQDMHEDNYFEHDSYDRVGGNLVKVANWFDRILGVYPFNTEISENILMNTSGSVTEAVEGWMNSPPHRANIMNGGRTEGAIGVYQGARGTYWTHDFGSRSISYNLAISDLSFEPAAPQPGDAAQVRFNLRNTGQTDAFPAEVILYRGNPSAGGVALTEVLRLPPILVAGNLRFTNVPPIDTTGFPLGSEVYVVLDPNNRFQETNESDNQLHGPLFGSQPPTGTPTPTQTLPSGPTPTSTPTPILPAPTPTITAVVACVEIVRDGGFEAGSPYPDWRQSYDRFVVLYSYYTGGPSPYEGSNFCWFGGINDGIEETASIDQSLALPAGAGELSYYVRVTQGLATDYMRVALDGSELARYTGADDPAYGSYTRVAHNVTAYCDGGFHELRIESTVSGIASFYIDNISLVVCPQGTSLGPRAEALFEFCHHWKVGSQGAGELLGILGSLP